MEYEPTPTEDLILEVLAARLRLGETRWPFDTKHGKAIKSLSKNGLVSFDHGNVESTYNVWLTPDGKSATVSPTYEAPIYKFLKEEFVDSFILT